MIKIKEKKGEKRKKTTQSGGFGTELRFLESVEASVNYFWTERREQKERGKKGRERGTKCPRDNARISWFLKTLDLAASGSSHLVQLCSPTLTSEQWTQQKASNSETITHWVPLPPFLGRWFLQRESHKEHHRITNTFHSAAFLHKPPSVALVAPPASLLLLPEFYFLIFSRFSYVFLRTISFLLSSTPKAGFSKHVDCLTVGSLLCFSTETVLN